MKQNGVFCQALDSQWRLQVLVDKLETEVLLEYQILDKKGEELAQGHLAKSISNAKLPSKFALKSAAPNPFNSQVLIDYEVAVARNLQLGIYNVAGQQVRLLCNEFHQPGYFQIKWDGRDDAQQSLGSGLYIVVLRAGAFHQAIKVILLQ